MLEPIKMPLVVYFPVILIDEIGTERNTPWQSSNHFPIARVIFPTLTTQYSFLSIGNNKFKVTAE